MRGTEGPDIREEFVEKVVAHLHRTVADKLAVLKEWQGLSEAEVAEVIARLQTRLAALAPEGPGPVVTGEYPRD